jgi:beta-lactam-binding protein with PASTA domain
VSDELRRPRRRRPRPAPGGGAKRRSWVDRLLLVSLAAFLIVAGLVAYAAYNWFVPNGKLVGVPSLIGMPFSQAESLASGAHVGLKVVAHRDDFHAPKGVIIGQLPSAGEKVREGRVIAVILSDGVPMVKTPNLSNMSLRDAQIALGNAHLRLGTVAETLDLHVIEGQVLEQHPDPFSPLPAGSSVDVTVAKGRPPLYAPSFVGMSIEVARTAAREAKVRLGTVTDMPLAAGAKPKGTIVAQDPQAGAVLTPGQTIALRVSGGPPPTPTPEPLASQLAAAPSPSPAASGSPPLPSPGAARAMRISVALPQSAVAQPIRVVLEDATGSRTIFDQTTTGGLTLSFDVTVVGQGTIETYVNDKLVSSTPL